MASDSNTSTAKLPSISSASNVSTLSKTDSSTNLISPSSTQVKTNSISPVSSQKKKKRVTDLTCSEVRWFVKRDGDSKWTALKGYDSLIIEVAWRRKNGIMLDEKTISLLDDIPKTENVIVLDGLYMLDEKSEQLDSVYWKDESVPLRRGSWFIADTMQPINMDLAAAIEKHHLQSFKDQSIPEGPVFSDAESSKRPVLTSMNWDEHEEIRWNSVIDVIWYNNSKTSKLIRFVTRSKGTVLRRGFNEEAQLNDGRPNFSDLILVVHGIGQKGYENLCAKNTAQLNDGRPNFSDLILVVHGIGQKGYENLCAKNTGQIRDALLSILEKYYPNEQRRPMILPIEWRSALILDNGLTDFITLPRMPGVRQAMNASAMDIMYYQSPLYRSEIINGVIKCMNSTYDLFMKNNPGFTGKVSILAHSLGSVITYDILTNWSPLFLYDKFVTNAIEDHLSKMSKDHEEKELFEKFYESRKKLFENEQHLHALLLNREDNLHFSVEHVFAIGSPLAVFLVMRGIDYTKVLPKNRTFTYFYNIFHPYDPVAYRLEPLFDNNYRYVRPVRLYYYSDERARKSYANLPYDLHKSYLKKLKKAQKAKDKEKGKEKGEEKDSDDDDDDDDDIISNGSSPRTATAAPQEEIEVAKEADSGGSVCSATPPPSEAAKRQPLTTVEALVDQVSPDRRLQGNLPGQIQRLDFFVQPGVLDKSYISMLNTAATAAPQEEIEVAKEADSGGSVCSATPPPSEAAKRQPLTTVEALVDQVSPDRRLQANLPGQIQRLDFFVQPGVLDKSYISMLNSHFGYWQNYDLIAFIANTLYPQPSEQGIVPAK
uniref:DDHD domain-containing protein n=1 Tax=Panagrolaimus sp. JU765 TaxID=591449 RepID=A0AC34QMG2_9BILA